MTPPRIAPLVIGLVNAMPGEARRRTEQQFRGILAAAAVAGGRVVELRLFSLDAPPPLLPGQARYADAATLEGEPLDGLIVTGMPPLAPTLPEEPAWPKLTAIIDHALDQGLPTLWSCLAAHVAVLYLDGIKRRRLPQKLSGLVDCVRLDETHPAVAGLPRRWQVPHSRYNEVPEAALRDAGYRILSHSVAGGADIFARDAGASFLFCQGHPEYDADTLLREYRRDIGQFLGATSEAGERATYPGLPQGCFGPTVTERLDGFRARAEADRDPACLADFPWEACVADLRHPWRDLTIALYANWLAMLAGHDTRTATGGTRAIPTDHANV